MDLPWMRKEPDSIASKTQDYATTLFASSQQLHAMLSTYFSRIHPWFPFISQQIFYERFQTLNSTSEHSFVLLLCSMHLILFIPPQPEVGWARSSTYSEVKRLLSLAEAQGPLVIDLVQCRILVTLYEMNHGAIDEAYLSLGSCARTGVVLGLNYSERPKHESDHRQWMQKEEERRTWWAITILDRYELPLEAKHHD